MEVMNVLADTSTLAPTMSHRDLEYIDTLSSGDSNNMQSKQTDKEVNNNEIDELSKELTNMGCIVDAVKRPPNICVETCVYEESDSENSANDEEDAYTDEFEEDKSEEEIVEEGKDNSESKEIPPNESSIKLSKSHSSVFSHTTSKPCSVSGKSGRSTDWGSSSVPPTRRVNMSFTNERLREIERHNNILLTKILSARNSKKSSIPGREEPPRRPVPSAAVQRKNQQRKIDHDNMILLKKIQRAKSSSYSVRR